MKIHQDNAGHMTKMAAMPIYMEKKHFKIMVKHFEIFFQEQLG